MSTQPESTAVYADKDLVNEVHQAHQIPSVDQGFIDHDKPIGWGGNEWEEFEQRGYYKDHAIAAARSYLYIPRKYRVHRRRFRERIGDPLFYFNRHDRDTGPAHGPWYMNRFNRQIVYGEEEFETNVIRPDPMLGFATRHPMLWGQEHQRLKATERQIERKEIFNIYLNKLTVHCFDTCVHKDDFTLENYELNDVEGRCIRQCFRRTIDAKNLTMPLTKPATTSFMQ